MSLTSLKKKLEPLDASREGDHRRVHGELSPNRMATCRPPKSRCSRRSTRPWVSSRRRCSADVHAVAAGTKPTARVDRSKATGFKLDPARIAALQTGHRDGLRAARQHLHRTSEPLRRQRLSLEPEPEVSRAAQGSHGPGRSAHCPGPHDAVSSRSGAAKNCWTWLPTST